MNDKCITITSLIGMVISFLVVIFTALTVMLSMGIKTHIAILIVGATLLGFILIVGVCICLVRKYYYNPREGYSQV